MDVDRPISPRPLSPITIEHRGELFLTATGTLPRAPDCSECTFCRCDVCSRLKDLGYDGRADYYNSIHRKNVQDEEQSCVVRRREERKERIRLRSSKMESSWGSESNDEVDRTEDSKCDERPSSIVSDVKPKAVRMRTSPATRLSPQKRVPLPRTAGRVIARHDIFSESKQQTRDRIAGGAPRSPFKISTSTGGGGGGGGEGGRGGGSKERRQ